MDDHRGGVRVTPFAPAAEPAPAAIGKLHLGESIHACRDDRIHLGFVEHRVPLEALPTFRSLDVVTDFLGVEVGALVANGGQVELHPPERLLRDHCRHEPIERLLGATVGIVEQVGQGVDHRPGQGRRVTHFQPSLLGTTLGGDGYSELAPLLFRTNDAGVRLGLEHAVHVNRETHCDGVRLFVGECAHANCGCAFTHGFYSPVEALLAACGNCDDLLHLRRADE